MSDQYHKKVSVIALQHPDAPNLYMHGLDRKESTWTLPGGHSNDGETPLEAAHRELEEEAGLSGIKLDKVHEGEYGDSYVTLFHGICPKDYKFDASKDPDQEFVSHKFLDPNNHDSMKFPTNNILIDWQKSGSRPPDPDGSVEGPKEEEHSLPPTITKSEEKKVKTPHPFKAGDKVKEKSALPGSIPKTGVVTATKTEDKTKHKIKVKHDDVGEKEFNKVGHGGKWDLWQHASYWEKHSDSDIKKAASQGLKTTNKTEKLAASEKGYKSLKSLAKDSSHNQNNPNLIHYSSQSGLKQIDPLKMGSGVKGAQYKRGVPENKSSFFYTQDSKPEDLVTQNAKSKYTVKMPENVYDYDKDPNNYAQQVLQSNQGAWNEDLFHGLLKQNGYNGVKWSMRPETQVVQLYHTHPVHEEQVLKSELKKTEISPFQNEQDVDKYLKNGNFSLLTGHTNTMTPEQSQQNHNNLLNELNQKGYSYTPVGGKWFGTDAEPSVMVHNLSTKDASELADKYKQKAHIQSTSGSHKEHTTKHADYNPPEGGSGHVIGSHLNDNYSEIKLPNGKMVRFSLDVGYPMEKKVKSYFKKLIKSNLIKTSSHIKNVAEDYANLNGMKLSHNYNVSLNPEHGSKIAAAYEAMPHNPEHPDVKAAYGALINETGKQFNHLINNGLKISKMQPNQENPYKTSKDMLHDLHVNNHLWYYPTEQGYGSNEQSKNHPLLQQTQFMHENRPMLANDVFRIVHDAFGHGLTNSTFGPKGEHTSYLAHKEMFSPLAQKALASETMGQNSVVNYGKNAAHNKANPANTIYAEQKAGLMPNEIINGKWHQ
jgi:8-oxo-dGTP pyrophosphatase MutT (NUDIX family)